jgi:hypothetical protein
MDEIKAQELFDFFNQEGYDLGDLNNFISALTDDVKREELYSFFNEEGYDIGSLENFTLKKKDESVSTVQEDVTESITPTEQEEPVLLESSTQEVEEPVAIDFTPEVTEESVPTDFTLTEQEEIEFQNWMATDPNVVAWREEFKQAYSEEPQIDNSNYDYRGAWKAGIIPQTNEVDGMYHWGSKGEGGVDLKSKDHPTRWKSDYMEATGINPDDTGITKEEALSVIEESVPTDFTPEVIDFSKGTENVAGEKDTLIERVFGKNEITDLFGDLYRAGAAGQAQGGSVDEALELFAKGSDASQEDIDDFIAAQKRMQSMGESDEMRDFQKIYQADGGGWLGFIKGVIANPTVIPQLFVSSVSAMATPATLAGAAGGAAAGAAIAGPAGALIGAMGMAGTTLETGLTYAELLQEELGGKEMTEENIREILGNQEKMNNIRFKAVGRGLTIGAIDAISGGIATKVVGKVAGMTGRKLLAGAAGGAVEAVGGSLGEVGGRLVAGQEMDIAEIGFEGIAGTATAPLTVGYGLYKAPKYSINGTGKDARVTGPDMAKFIREASPQDLIKAEVNIVNDNELQSIYDEKYKEAIVSEDIKKVSPDMNKPTLDAITKLQVELDNLKSNETQPAKDRAKVIKEEIKNLQENPITEGEARETDITVDGDDVSTTTNVVTEEFAAKKLAEEGVINPTPEQISEKQQQILKEQADAIQEPSTETVDVQEQAGDSQTVGEGDSEVSELTTETTQEVQESDVSPEVQAEVDAIEADERIDLSELDAITPTEEVVAEESTPRFRLDGLETQDQETSAITEEMNKMDKNEIEFKASGASRDYEVNPIKESNSIKKITQKALDFIGVKSENDLLKPLDFFDGIPMLTGMSDILASGTVKDAQGNNMDVDGGIMFNILGKNTEAAWAGVNEDGAKTQFDNAVRLYEENKVLFDKLWDDGKLPQGHVPMAIARMSDSAINSNEAIFRYVSPAIKSAPKKNQVKALADLQVSLDKAKTSSQKSTVGKKKVAAAIKLQEFIKKNKIKTLGQLTDLVIKQANQRAKGDMNTLTLDDRKLLFESIIYPPGAKKNNRAVIKSLAEGNPKFNVDAFFADNIYKAIGEPSMMKGAHGDIVAVVGIDVTDKGGVTEVSHDNYGFGPKGKAIALISKPKHGIDVFSTWKAKASRVFKRNKKGEFPTKEATAQQVGGAFFNDKVFQSDPAKTKQSNLDILIGKLKFAFPSVNVATSQVEFDAILDQPGVRTQESNGKTILGLTKDGKIFINPAFDSLATPIHEFGHIWTDFLRSDASGKKGTALLARGLKLVEGTDALKAAIEKYGDTKLAREEALVELMATKGETITNAAQKSKFKEWMNATFKYIKQNFTTSDELFKGNIKDIENLTLDEFINTGLADLFSGKPLDAKSKTKFDAKAEAQASKARFELGDSSNKKAVKSAVEKLRGLGYSEVVIGELLKQKGVESNLISEVLATNKKSSPKAKVTEDLVPGSKKVENAIDDIIKRTQDRANKKNNNKGPKNITPKVSQEILLKNAIEYLKSTPLYERASDVVREELVRGVRKKLSLKEKSSPSKATLDSNFGKEITTTDKKLYAKRLKDLQEGAKTAQQAIQESSKLITENVKALVKKGSITNGQAQRILNRFAKVDVLNEVSIDSFMDYMANVYNKSEDKYKKTLISEIRKRVSKSAKKTKSVDADSQQFFEVMEAVLNKVLATIDGKPVKIDADDIKKSLFPDIDTILQKEFSELTNKEKSQLYASEIFESVDGLRDMSLEQVEQLLEDIKRGQEGGRMELKKKLDAFRAEVKETKNQADKDIEDGYSELFEDGKPKDKNQLDSDRDDRRIELFGKGLGEAINKYAKEFSYTNVGKMLQAIGNNLKHLGTLTNGLDKVGSFFTENVYNALNKMESVYTKGLQNTRTKMDEIAKTIDGIDSYKDIKKKLATGVHKITGLKTSKGGVLSSDSFNADQLMRLYALSKNKVQRDKLLAQGLTDSKLKEIESILGKEVVEFVDKTVEYLSTEYFENTNEVYSDVNNVNLGYVDNYFPTQTIQTKVNADLLENGDFSGVFNAQTAPALKERVDLTGDVDLRGSDFTSTLQDHFETIERYKGYAKGVKKMNAIFKFKSVNTLLTETGLGKAVKNAINYAVNPNGGKAAIQSNLVDKLMTKYTGFALAFKAVQILKQSTSFVNAFEDYSYRGKGKSKVPGLDLLMFMVDGAKVIATMPSQIKKAWNLSPMFQERLLKGLEGDVYGLETGSVTYKPASQSQKSKAFRMLKAAAGSPTVLGDVLGVMGYMINFNRDIANGMSEADAVAKFEDYNTTQQSRRSTDKIPLQMDSNSLVRGFTMFGSTVFLQMNKVMQSTTNILRSVSQGEKPSAKSVRGLVLNLGVANVMFALAANIAKFIKGEDEDREEALDKMKDAMMGLNLIYQIPYFGASAEEAVNKMRGNSSRPIDSVVNPFSSVSRKFTKLAKLSKEDKENGESKAIGSAVRTLTEIGLGVQFDPFIGLANAFQGDFSEENMYDVLGVSSSYRPKGTSETQIKKDKLGQYNSETDMKRYDKALWRKTFGPESEGYLDRVAEKKAKAIERKAKQAEKDALYNYKKKNKKSKSTKRGIRNKGKFSGR